jgi:hypothetical protein
MNFDLDWSMPLDRIDPSDMFPGNYSREYIAERKPANALPYNSITGLGGAMARASEGPRVTTDYGDYWVIEAKTRGNNLRPYPFSIQRFDGANTPALFIYPNSDEITLDRTV